jgi:hypothetical protein
MSNDNNGEQRIPVECVLCKQHFSVPFPPIEVLNGLRSSSIVASHPNLIRCPNGRCRAPYTLAIVGQYSVSFATVPVNEEAVAQIEGSRIIKPTLGLVH